MPTTLGAAGNASAQEIDIDDAVARRLRKELEASAQPEASQTDSALVDIEREEGRRRHFGTKEWKNIILITDGQVSDGDVQNCDKILENYQFESTICYIIASSSYGKLNMSVTCPFTRKCDNKVYEKP